MATIVYREGRPKPWLAQIKRKGHGVYSRSFGEKRDALTWARKEDLSIDETGRPFTIKQYDNITVGSLAKRYLAEVSPSKASYPTDRSILTNIHRYKIANKSISVVSSKDAADYRDERLKENTTKVVYLDTIRTRSDQTVSPYTVRRAVNTLQHVFEIARAEWGYHNINNPFSRLRIKGSQPRRTRRLEGNELEKLLEATDGCKANKHYIWLAIALAIHTGMRLQEIFNLRYQDIGMIEGPGSPAEKLAKRRIVIRKSKTDYKTGLQGRTIVMSVPARVILGLIMFPQFEEGNSPRPDVEIFPMSKDAFKQVWKRVVRWAGITNLTFHDLRHEAASRFDELGLSKAEHELMMGHKSRDMTSRYVHADLKRIQEKLDGPFYARYKSKVERFKLGLPLLGDETDGMGSREDYPLPVVDLVLSKP
jgi:integrase